jgi:Surp module
MLPCSYDVTQPAATMYRYVAKDGAALESSLMSRERNNPEFAFLFEHGTEEGVYYR